MSIVRFLFLFASALPVFAQNIHREWVKVDILMGDSSRTYSADIQRIDKLHYDFQKPDTLLIISNESCIKRIYSIKSDTLIIQHGLNFKIEQINEQRIALQEIDADKQKHELIKIIFEDWAYHQKNHFPESYRTIQGDTIFIANGLYLEPRFLADKNAMSYIFDKLAFPEWKTGQFVLRFIITKKGEIKRPEIIYSTDDKYELPLLKALTSTKGLWQAAQWQSQAVNVEMEFNFDLSKEAIRNSFSEADKEQKLSLAEGFYTTGVELIKIKRYTLATRQFNFALKENPYHIGAYFNRADCYFKLKDLPNACKDWKTLVSLEQKRAEEMYQKNCQQNK